VLCYLDVHLIITDSGLGGLSICAGIERALRESGHGIRITYVNAWPEQGRGYNDLPDVPSRARQFDVALRAMTAMRPDRIVIACNTLSILYEHTAFQSSPPVPVDGIVETGVAMFQRALESAPDSSIVLLGTRTTIESGVHRDRLAQRGIDPARIAGVACHGLAAAIERSPLAADTVSRIEACAEQAVHVAPPGEPLLAGLCCTHYGLIADRLIAAIGAHAGRGVARIDPNAELARDVVSKIRVHLPGGAPQVEMVSKVSLDDEQRTAVAAAIEPASPATAGALRRYRHVPDLF
jgi:glutamate racemase